MVINHQLVVMQCYLPSNAFCSPFVAIIVVIAVTNMIIMIIISVVWLTNAPCDTCWVSHVHFPHFPAATPHHHLHHLHLHLLLSHFRCPYEHYRALLTRCMHTSHSSERLGVAEAMGIPDSHLAVLAARAGVTKIEGSARTRQSMRDCWRAVPRVVLAGVRRSAVTSMSL